MRATKSWPTNAGHQEMTDLVESRSLKKVCERYPVVTIGGGKSRKRVPGLRWWKLSVLLPVSSAVFCAAWISTKSCRPNRKPGSADRRCVGPGHDVNRTWQPTGSVKSGTSPTPSCRRSDGPSNPERIQLLISTLTEYVQLIELRLGADDDAQVIFESLNDRGERCFPADLVRNFVFLEATRNNASAAALYDHIGATSTEAPAEKGHDQQSKLFWKVDERQGPPDEHAAGHDAVPLRVDAHDERREARSRLRGVQSGGWPGRRTLTRKLRPETGGCCGFRRW